MDDTEYAAEWGEHIRYDVEKLQQECPHTNTVELNGATVCTECGVEQSVLDSTAEWKYKATESSRCYYSHPSRNLKDVIDRLNLPSAIGERVEEKYRKVVGDKTIRGSSRSAIIAACLMYTYLDMHESRPPHEIAEMLNLDMKHLNPGLVEYHKAFPSDRTRHLTPADLIHRVMVLTGVPRAHYPYLLQMARYLADSPKLKRSNPWSVATAIVYLYLNMPIVPMERESAIDKITFSQAVGLSDITIIKLAKDAAEQMGVECILR